MATTATPTRADFRALLIARDAQELRNRHRERASAIARALAVDARYVGDAADSDYWLDVAAVLNEEAA